MNKRIKATIALLVIISIIMPFIPFKAIAFNAEDRPYYAEIQLRGVTAIDNDNHQIECGNGEVHYATVTVEDENAILEENEGNYFLYTQENSLGFLFTVEEGYTAFTRVDGAPQPSEVNENYYNMEQLEMDHNYNLDFEFIEENNNPGGNQGGNGGNNNSFIEVSFDTGDINENVATFNVDNEEITVTISGAEMNGGSVLVDRSNMNGVTFTLSNNFNRETMQVIIRGADQYNAIVEPDEYGVATLNGLNIPDGGVILGIEHKGNGGNNNNNNEYEDITLNVTFNDTMGEVVLNNSFHTQEGAVFLETLPNAGYTDNTKTNKIQVNTSYGENAASKVTINGTEYDYDPNGYDVAGASTYTIVVTGDPSVVTPKTIIWANPDYVPVDEEDAEWIADFTIHHGYARAIAVYDDQNQLLDPSEYTNGQSDEFGLRDGLGWVGIYPGSRVIFEFEPEYGYQLTDIKINDEQIENPTETPNQYEFTMIDGSGNIHFSANFEPKENTQTIGLETSISDMSYTLEDGALNSGTAVLSIDKVNDLSDEQKEGFADIVGNDYEVSTYLDVDLTQVWYKGKDDANDVWSNEIYDLGDKKATITVTLDAGVTPDDIVILHEVHDDEGNIIGYEKVKIINKEQDVNGIWTVTFETSRFSNYAIAEKKEGTSATYEVTFETDDGTQIPSQEVASGETVTKPEDPIKDGFSFGGWYADDTFAVEFDFDTPITQNATVYAKWIPDGATAYTVTIVNEHGDNFEAQSVEYGTRIRQLSVYNYYTTVKQSETEGYGVLTIARKPLSEYTSTEAILADSIDADDNSIYDDAVKGDVTYYVIWFELIDEVEVEVAAPVCGTSTTTNKNGNNEWDVNSQTNGPQVTIPGNAKYQIGGTIDDQEFIGSAWVETSDNEEVTGPFIGTFEGGEKYNAYIMLTADFGYMFQETNSSYYETISEVEATHNLTHVDAVDATCTTDGSKEYYECSGCDKKFVDSDASEEITDVTIPAGHDWNDWVVTKEATVDEAGSKTRTCKRDASHTETEEIAKLPYEVVEGENQTIEAEEGEDLIVKANGSVDKFVKLLVDGEEVDPANYTITPGSTIATLSSSFLDTLSSGNHTLTFVYTDGQAQTNFRIASANNPTQGNTPGGTTDGSTEDSTEGTTSTTGKSSEETSSTKLSNPKTGDNIYNYVVMFAIATVGLMMTKKNKKVTRNKRKH